ncbi:unnamed protein product [Angiostrongylus costaricensis]|uniref:UDENN FLCN/SMCR8-type domain-containing protein n=1 Tax=Angiostrongylus costaricensis TaxID=334426 RepID=A0A158PF74_ANGCS|nr:unnamed protein product [Angiostrongylus costaricensis]
MAGTVVRDRTLNELCLVNDDDDSEHSAEEEACTDLRVENSLQSATLTIWLFRRGDMYGNVACYCQGCNHHMASRHIEVLLQLPGSILGHAPTLVLFDVESPLKIAAHKLFDGDDIYKIRNALTTLLIAPMALSGSNIQYIFGLPRGILMDQSTFTPHTFLVNYTSGKHLLTVFLGFFPRVGFQLEVTCSSGDSTLPPQFEYFLRLTSIVNFRSAYAKVLNEPTTLLVGVIKNGTLPMSEYDQSVMRLF